MSQKLTVTLEMDVFDQDALIKMYAAYKHRRDELKEMRRDYARSQKKPLDAEAEGSFAVEMAQVENFYHAILDAFDAERLKKEA